MRRVAVLPLQTVGVEAPQRARLQRAIERAARRREREVVPGHETLGATKQACRDAQPDVRCAREAGRALTRPPPDPGSGAWWRARRG